MTRNILFFLVLFAPLAASDTSEFEQRPVFSAGDLLPAELLEGEHYRIADEVQNDGFMNLYVLESDYGRFWAYGDLHLLIRIQEIRAITELRTIAGADVAPGDTPITEDAPVISIARLFSGEQDEFDIRASEKPIAEAGKELAPGLVKRRWARRVDVDPYTSNEMLQRELDRVAASDRAGKVSTGFIPGVSVMGFLGKGYDVVYDYGPAGLRRMNADKLKGMGVPDATIETFLNNRAYTPSLATTLINAMADIDADGREIFITRAAGATNRREAYFFQQAAQLYDGYHETQKPIVKFIPAHLLANAVNNEGQRIAMAGVDYLIWTQDIAEGAAFQDAHPDGSNFEVWLAGAASPRFQAEAAVRGWIVHHNARELFGLVAGGESLVDPREQE